MKPWKLLREEVLFQNEFARLEKQRYLMPAGNEADYFIHGTKQHVATVVAVTPDEKFIMAREYRPGPGVIIDESPGGLMDEGEDPKLAAERELLEETGYKGEMHFLGRTYISAYSPKLKYCFIALNCKKVAEPNHDGNEFIEVVLKSKEEFIQQVEAGDFTDQENALWALRYLGW